MWMAQEGTWEEGRAEPSRNVLVAAVGEMDLTLLPPPPHSVLYSVCLWGHWGREDTHHAGKGGGPWHHVPDYHGTV
jgi:hypothetical protein